MSDLLQDGEDVSHCTDRQLVLRAVNACLVVSQQVGHLSRKVDALSGRTYMPTSYLWAVALFAFAMGGLVVCLPR